MQCPVWWPLNCILHHVMYMYDVSRVGFQRRHQGFTPFHLSPSSPPFAPLDGWVRSPGHPCRRSLQGFHPQAFWARPPAAPRSLLPRHDPRHPTEPDVGGGGLRVEDSQLGFPPPTAARGWIPYTLLSDRPWPPSPSAFPPPSSPPPPDPPAPSLGPSTRVQAPGLPGPTRKGPHNKDLIGGLSTYMCPVATDSFSFVIRSFVFPPSSVA